MVERQEVRSAESAERVGKGKYSVATVRVMAGIPHTEMAKPARQLNLDQHKQRLKDIQPDELDHSHIVEVSTQERLRDARIDIPANADEATKAKLIADANKGWRDSVLSWLGERKDYDPQVLEAVKFAYNIDLSDMQAADSTLEQLRSAVFDTKGTAGEADIPTVVDHFVHKFDDAGNKTGLVSEEDIQKYLGDIKPFLYIFGGEKTVARLEYAILATSALANAPTDPQAREAWAKAIEPLLEQEIDPQEAEHYTPGPSLDHDLAVNGDGRLVPTADEAPIEEETVNREVESEESQSGQGENGTFSGGERNRRGVGEVAIAIGGAGDGAKSGDGREGGQQKKEASRVILTAEQFKVREFVPMGPSQEAKLDQIHELVERDPRLGELESWYQRRVDAEKPVAWVEGELGGKGQWNARIYPEKGPTDEQIAERVEEVQVGRFTFVAYKDNTETNAKGEIVPEQARTVRYMAEVANSDGTKDRLRVEGEGFNALFEFIGIEGPAYNQGIIREKGKKLTLPDGREEEVTGFVGVILHKGSVLLFTKKSNGVNYVEARGAQLSLDHYENLYENKLPVVGEMAALFNALYGDRPQRFIEDLRTGKPSFSDTGNISYNDLPMYNSDRATGNNKRFIIDLGDGQDELAEQLAANGGKWCTAEEVEALGEIGIINALGAAAIMPLVRPRLATFPQTA